MEEERYYHNITELKEATDVNTANALLTQGYELLAIRERIATEGDGKNLKINGTIVYIFGKKIAQQTALQTNKPAQVIEGIDEKLAKLEWKQGKNERSEIAPANDEVKKILANGKVEGKQYTYYLTKGGNVLRFKKDNGGKK